MWAGRAAGELGSSGAIAIAPEDGETRPPARRGAPSPAVAPRSTHRVQQRHACARAGVRAGQPAAGVWGAPPALRVLGVSARSAPTSEPQLHALLRRPTPSA